MNQSMIPTIKYSMLQGSYWMSFCVINNFATLYLLSKDFTNQSIGVVIGLASVFAALLQPMVAAFADRTKSISLRHLTGCMAFLTLACIVVFWQMPDQYELIAIVFAVIITLMMTIQPLINAMGMELYNRNIPINFGFARGVGSLTYAVVSFGLGWLIEQQGTSILPICYVIAYGWTTLMIWLFQVKYHGQSNQVPREDSMQESWSDVDVKIDQQNDLAMKHTSSITQILFHNKNFTLLLLGITCLFVCHNLINNYMIHVIRQVGGRDIAMGTAVAIAAALELPIMGSFGYLLKKFHCHRIVQFSAIFFSIKALLTLLAFNVTGIYLAQATQMFAFALFIPASVYYVNGIMKDEDRIKGQALMSATSTIGSIVGSLLGGWLIDLQGIGSALGVGLVFSLIGTMLVILFVVPIHQPTVG